MPSASRRSTSPAAGRRTYVLDTSVLLADPGALQRFDEHEVVLPVVVITELEAKRSHPELGYFARTALRALDDLRVDHGRLDHPVPLGDNGGSLRVELEPHRRVVLPSGFQLRDNDTRILAVARNLAAEGSEVVLVSKDLPMRVKASAVGLTAEEYRAELVVDQRLDRHDRARRERRGRRRALRRRGPRPRRRPGPALPHRSRPAVRPRQRAWAG